MPAKIYSPTPANLRLLAGALQRGELVGLPTETVYGLAARADSAAAVAAIYRAKGRPDFNPLIVHVGNLAAGEAFAEFDARARLLAEAFWPGPLTMVLPLRAGTRIAAAVTAGLPTIALRCPAHPAMQALLALTGLPLAAPTRWVNCTSAPCCASAYRDQASGFTSARSWRCGTSRRTCTKRRPSRRDAVGVRTSTPGA